MKLLFLTPQLPYPPRQGTTIRNYNLIRHLAADQSVHLFTFLAPGDRLTPENPLHRLCERIEALPQPIRSLRRRAVQTALSPWPDMGLRLADARADRCVRQMIEEEGYDIVQAEGLEMAAYARHARRSPHPSPRLVFDDHNAEYLLQRRAALVDLRHPRRWMAAAYSLVQWRKLRRYERWICRQADAVIAVSEPDRQALRRLDPTLDPIVIPNGIDIERYRPAPAAMPSPPPTLVFTGKMDYRPNVDAVLWFAQQVLPRLRTERADVTFQIVGMNPHPRLAPLHADPNIVITGAVDEILPYIQRASIYVVPMRVGGGTRFKVLEAMACGKALVSTTLGVEGIGVTHGENILIADDPATYAQIILDLLRDQERGGQRTDDLGNAARTFVAEHYAWSRILPRLRQLYAHLHSDHQPNHRLSKEAP